MNPEFLAIIDVDRIHDYVFLPQQLKLIRGASQILRELTEDELIHPLGLSTDPSRLVSSAGGTVLAMFEQCGSAEDYCRLAVELFRKRTASATVSWAIAKSKPTFRETLEATSMALEKKKSGRAVLSYDAGNPYFSICQDCGLHASASTYDDLGRRQRTCCPGCEQRRRSGDRHLYVEEIEKIAGITLRRNESFEDLGKHSKNYLAFIYIDVDRLGRYLYENGGESPEAYGELSRKIKNGMETAVFNACAALCRPPGQFAPFEILLMGGDDAILVLPAQYVFQFFRSFDQKFREFSGNLGRSLNYSAAVVWAHQQFPIARFREHAEALVRLAKNKSGNTIEYDVITSALINAPSDSPARREYSVSAGYSLRLTQKPYSVDDFLQLESTIREWRQNKVPANKVKALYRIAFESFEQSMLDYWFLFSRLDKGHREPIRKFFNSPYGLWSSGMLRTTGAVDLVELWDFVEGS